MWTFDVVLLSLAALSSSAVASSEFQTLYKRGIIQSSDVQSSYDYIIAGGGLAGLVLASRLSEDPKVSVLVLEAGKSGDEAADRINAPAGTYYSSIVGTEYDWQHVTVPQPGLNDRVIGWPRGKVLGGSSAMNAMYLVKPSSTEMNAWQEVVALDGDSSASSNWGWDKMSQYMKKSENFTAPNSDVLSVVDIKYDASTHGNSGPMQISYPAVMIDIVSNWTSACAGAGIPELAAPNGGVTLGGFITPSSINPTNWTRSFSKSAYIDPLPPRSNLHILAEATVARVVLSDSTDSSGNYFARGIEFAKDPSSPRVTVNVKKEVVLAGGALGSPKILLHSGVGPKDVLDAASVNVKVELPGVGQRLQDHMTAGVVWETPLETAGNIHDSNSDFARSREFLSFINDAVAFANITALLNGPGTEFQQEILAAIDNSTANLVPSQYPEVRAGYKKMYEISANKFYPEVAQLELLMSVISPGVVSIQSAIQHPFSIGRAWINSTNPFDPILIDPQYYSHFADIVLMRAGIRLVRAVGAAYGATFGRETFPGPDFQTDEAIDAWLIHTAAGTQYHPTGSCAMLPKNLGGVVDAKLKVHGIANVRIADASVFPFEFAAHLASATYAVAEQASDLIKANSYTVPNSEAASSARIPSMSLSIVSVVALALAMFMGAPIF